MPAADPFGAPPPAADDPFSGNQSDTLRMWTDLSGKYRLEAKFVGVIDGKTVRLQKADGRYYRIALERLCLADQAVVLRHIESIAAVQ